NTNGNNAAKTTTATFTKAGNYEFQVTVKDAGNLTAVSTVQITVDQTLTAVVVSPATATIMTSATQQFTATARDQFATNLTIQPDFSWSVSDGGTVASDGVFSAGTSEGSPYTVIATSGNVSDTAIVTVIRVNLAPTIVTAATATSDPVTGTTTTLSVLGNDDNDESNLTYTWTTSGVPPAAVNFSNNGTNAAKNTLATFTRAGVYTFAATIRDQENLAVTSMVTVTVNQTLTNIVVSPTTASIVTSTTQQFTATACDQFATNFSTQPAFTWSVSGGGTISSGGLFTAGTAAGGPYTITVSSGNQNAAANVTVTAVVSPIYRINCGSANTVSPFTGDQYASGGTQRTVTNAITISGIANPAPQRVYQSERYGTCTYTLPNLTAGAQYTVRLHFAELYQTARGKRRFNVGINGTTVLSNFDIYAATGTRYKAVLQEFMASANASGQIIINLTTITDNATISGIEIIRK
ncbi:MAG TPA: malectin domain-containing carbohydrate-binding protein, partial [Chitinispirillaceae bacterium]|nr:malectin domain-containing carbohydrate-binding protein [Chitinispirillaceae bacterium]